MRPGKKQASRSPARNKGSKQDTASGVPTWPRLDLLPPELMLGGLRDWGQVSLKAGYLDHADYAVVKKAVKRLRITELLDLLGRVKDPSLASKLLELIAGIAGAAYVVGAHGGMTDTQRVFFEKSRATHMRIRRATSSEEQELRAALKAAVEASKGEIPSGRPYKDAESIIDTVNARVRKPVKVDVIARRIAALFKNAKK